MRRCRFCLKKKDFFELCRSTRDMEESATYNATCLQALLTAGGGEYSVNQERAAKLQEAK